MPIYEYQCGACGNRFELIQRLSDAPVEICPKCGEPKVHKLMSSPAIQFKGSGFYINDYAKSGAKSEGKSEGKSESKSEPKADAKSSSDKSEKSDKSTPAASTTSAPSTSSSSPSTSTDKT